jgi:CheY-like chemotaxis protein
MKDSPSGGVAARSCHPEENPYMRARMSTTSCPRRTAIGGPRSSAGDRRPELGGRGEKPGREEDDPDTEAALLKRIRRGSRRAPATGRRVLVVDDEPSIRMLCAVNLGLNGFVVTEAENGAEALELASREEFDLVLLDVMLPDIGGPEVARQLARSRRTRDVPVVFISARADKADLRLGYEVGGLDYITKPFDPTALGPRLEEVLARVARGESETFRRTRLDELRKEPP